MSIDRHQLAVSIFGCGVCFRQSPASSRCRPSLRWADAPRSKRADLTEPKQSELNIPTRCSALRKWPSSATERPLNLDALTPAFEWSACQTRIHSIGRCNGGKRLSRGSTPSAITLSDLRPDEFRNAAGPQTASQRWSGSRRSCWVFGVVVTSLHIQTCVPLRPPTAPVDVPASHSQNSMLDTDP